MPRFQFVNGFSPEISASSDPEKRTLTHSHAIRQAHAKKRRQRMQTYHGEASQKHAGMQDTTAVEARLVPLSRMPSNSRDPFSTLPRPMSSQEYFLFDHYIRSVVPNMVSQCSTFNSIGNLEILIIRDWVSLAIMDAGFLNALLLGACRHILRLQPDDPSFKGMALGYRQSCLHGLRQNIGGTSSAVNLLTFAKSLALAFDEINSGEVVSARQHLCGALAMARLNGGPEALGLTELLGEMYYRLSNNGVSPEIVLVRCE